jgi:hypothetical protein
MGNYEILSHVKYVRFLSFFQCPPIVQVQAKVTLWTELNIVFILVLQLNSLKYYSLVR